ncbi:MAG: ABC-F family ATP-binding cassette domain-containing protein [Alphaproteobacteria bacterium]|nr:ABC-F family ATP-binding cassette domain-containing protein [Alphaproteobacteria bacterium]
MLRITDIAHQIGGRVLFDGASAQIGDRQKIGLVGRNGSGKTTLLRMLMQEASPDRGEISLSARRRIGAVAQEAPDGPAPLIDIVLAADTERAALLAELAADPSGERVGEIHARLSDIDAHAAEARAATILAGLGFDAAAQARPVGTFSGGWRMRVALAAALFAQPDFLLLDEPTNHLDMEAALWLESYLARYAGGLLLVSHDRELLNRIPDAILHLQDGKLTLYAGGFDRFERTRAERQARQAALYTKQQAQRRRIQSFVDRFRAKATKARQAQSRLKMLERMEPIAAVAEDRATVFTLPKPEPLSPPLLTLEAASAGYDAAKPILRDLDLRIDMDDRIALLGVNGAGKTTLLRLLARRLKPLGGTLRASSKLQIGYFAQNQLEDLPPDKTPVEHLQALSPMATEQSLRTHLGGFAFEQSKADTKIAALSGGEKARLALAVICRAKPHILLLDEPTNHLDIDARQALIQALADYEGAVILVSHDPHIVAACADRLWIVGDGGCTPYDGDLNDYRTGVLSARRGDSKRDGDASAGSGSKRKEHRRERAVSRAALQPLRDRIRALSSDIDKKTKMIAKLHERLADPALYEPADGAANAAAGFDAATLNKAVSQLQEDLETAETEWLTLSEELEEREAAL